MPMRSTRHSMMRAPQRVRGANPQPTPRAGTEDSDSLAFGEVRGATLPQRDPAPGRRPLVVLAEDDAEMRALLTLTLRDAGYAVLECSDGTVLVGLLHTLTTAHQLARVSLVVTDLRMPGRSGMDALKALPKGRRPPLILITAFGDPRTVETAFELGADAVFDKPFDTGLLLVKARELIAGHPPHAPAPAVLSLGAARPSDARAGGLAAPNQNPKNPTRSPRRQP